MASFARGEDEVRAVQLACEEVFHPFLHGISPLSGARADRGLLHTGTFTLRIESIIIISRDTDTYKLGGPVGWPNSRWGIRDLIGRPSP
jgi:hypothetical protein